MNVLFLNHNFSGEGTYFRNYHLARLLASRGWDVILLTVSRSRRFTPEVRAEGRLKVIETPGGLVPTYLAENGCSLFDLLWRVLFIVCNRFDVVVGSDHLPNVLIPFLTAKIFRRGKRLVADWADLFSRGGCHARWRGFPLILFAKIEEWIEFGVKKMADGCMATSRPLLKLLREEIGIPESRSLHLPSGCDASVWTRSLASEQRRREIGLPEDLFMFGRTGRKGRVPSFEISEIIRLGQHYRALTGKKAGVYLIGDHRRGDYPEFIDAGLAVFVSGLLPSSEVPSHVAACEVAVLLEEDTPFNRHRGPIRLADYLIAGRPVICNEVGDHSSCLIESGAGICSSPADGENPLLDSLLTDRADRERRGMAARQLAERDLSWTVLGEKMDQFLQNL